MGNKCQQVCSNIANDRAQYFIDKSQKAWVRSLDLKKYQKHIISAKSERQQQQSYNLIHDSQQYTRGIIFTDTSFYQGTLDANKAEGKGLEKFIIEGHKGIEILGWYEGDFHNNARDGSGTYHDENVEFKGRWKQGYPVEGQLIIFNSMFKVNDAVTKAREKQVLRVEMLHFNNKQFATGMIRMILPNKCVYEGEIARKNANIFAIEGIGTMRMPNGDTYNGGFANGKFTGEGTYVWERIAGENKKKFEGQFKNGIKNGIGKLYVSDNKYIEGRWTDGKKEGVHRVMEVNSLNAKVYLCDVHYRNDRILPEDKTKV